jgi:hypothetical protein
MMPFRYRLSVLAVTLASLLPAIGRAEHPDSALELQPASAATLEQAFWLCDYVATKRGIDATPIAACTAVYAELRDARFSGDFEQLLAWWRENKNAEHQKMEARGVPD